MKLEHAPCRVWLVTKGRVLEVAEEGPLAQRPAPVERIGVLVSIIRVAGQVSVVPHEEDPGPLQAARCCAVPVEHVRVAGEMRVVPDYGEGLPPPLQAQ